VNISPIPFNIFISRESAVTIVAASFFEKGLNYRLLNNYELAIFKRVSAYFL